MYSLGIVMKALIKLMLSGKQEVKYELSDNSHFKGRYVVRSNDNMKHFNELP